LNVGGIKLKQPWIQQKKQPLDTKGDLVKNSEYTPNTWDLIDQQKEIKLNEIKKKVKKKD